MNYGAEPVGAAGRAWRVAMSNGGSGRRIRIVPGPHQWVIKPRSCHQEFMPVQILACDACHRHDVPVSEIFTTVSRRVPSQPSASGKGSKSKYLDIMLPFSLELCDPCADRYGFKLGMEAQAIREGRFALPELPCPESQESAQDDVAGGTDDPAELVPGGVQEAAGDAERPDQAEAGNGQPSLPLTGEIDPDQSDAVEAVKAPRHNRRDRAAATAEYNE